MTMIDEDALRRALHGVAERIEVPDGALEILEAARRLEGHSAARRHLHRRGRTDRVDGPAVRAGAQADQGLLTPRRRGPARRVLVGAVAAVALVGLLVSAVVTLGGSPSSRSRSAGGDATAGQGLLGPAATGGLARGGPATTIPAAGEGSAPEPPTAVVNPPLPSGSVGQSAKVEENGSVNLSVGKGKLGPVVSRLTELAAANGGFVANTQTQAGGSGNTPAYGSVTLQVPEASFDAVVAQVRTFGTVTSISTKGTDVTGQYVDLQSRIAALEASRNQYLTIMTRASSISDILAVQNQLDTLQGQIEQLQGQLQVLDSETTYATLAVSVTEPGGHPPPPAPKRSGIASAWHGAVSGFAAAFDGLVRIAGPLLFVVLLLLALLVAGRFTWRGLRRRAL